MLVVCLEVIAALNSELIQRDSKRLAGKVPKTLISDRAPNFGHAHKKQYAAKNFLHKESTHERHIHMAGDMNNNPMESFNGNTVRHREKVMRGIKSDDSAVISGMRIHHNFIRSHQGMKVLPYQIVPVPTMGP